MLPTFVDSARDAVSGISDGDTVLVGGFGGAGSPVELIHALIDHGARGLTVVNNNAGNGKVGLAALIAAGRVAKLICSFPRASDSTAFQDAYRSGKIELELVPQGTLAERIRAGGAGIPAFYTATAAGTELALGKPTAVFDGREYILERAIKADVALVKAARADQYGNLVYNKSARNFGPVMCMAANEAIVQVSEVVAVGELDPENIVTPGIFVSKIVRIDALHEEARLAAQEVYP